jgi:hypothetical protein
MNLFSYLRSLLSMHRNQFDRELDEELRAHIEQHAGDLERSGLPRPAAERRARIRSERVRSKESTR